MEDVLLPVDGQNTVLEGALPIQSLVRIVGVYSFHRDLPLVLDTLHLVVHAQHDVSEALIVYLIIRTAVFGIVKIRVDRVLVILLAVIPTVMLRRTLAFAVSVARRLVAGCFFQGDHEATPFHGLCLRSNSIMNQSIDLNTAELFNISIRLLQQDRFEIIVLFIRLCIEGTIRLRIVEVSLTIRAMLLLLLLLLGRRCLLSHVLAISCLRILGLTLLRLTLRLMAMLNGVYRANSTIAVALLKKVGCTVGGNVVLPTVHAAEAHRRGHGDVAGRFLLDRDILHWL